MIEHGANKPMSVGARMWLAWVGVTNALVGGFALLHPSFLGNSAYGWATALLPFWGWGILMVLVSLLCLAGRWRNNRIMAVIGLGLSMWVQIIFGLSIFALTISGTLSAIAGSVQWWVSARISAFFLGRGL